MEPRFDIAPARKYGMLVTVFSWAEMRDLTADVIMSRADEMLFDYCDADYILMAGSPKIFSTLVAMAARYNSRVNILEWEEHSRSYIVHTMDFNWGIYNRE
jgi:hypothetical protein